MEDVMSASGQTILYNERCSGGMPLTGPMRAGFAKRFSEKKRLGCILILADPLQRPSLPRDNCEQQRHRFICELALDGQAADFRVDMSKE